MLTGTLDDFALTDVFRLLSLAEKTGRLDVSRQAGTGKVFFRKGDVLFADSSLAHEPLGQKLVRAGALTEGQLRRALDERAGSRKRLGEILLASQTVSPQELEDAVRGQTEDAVFDLLRWERGEFSWEQGEDIEVEVPIAVSVENLIMEASRRLDELDVISRKIASSDVVVAMASKPPEGAVEINITPDEWRMLVLVNGARSVRDIGETVGVDEFNAIRTVYGLVSAGLIEVVSNSSGGGHVEGQQSSWRPEPKRHGSGTEATAASSAVDVTARPEDPSPPPEAEISPLAQESPAEPAPPRLDEREAVAEIEADGLLEDIEPAESARIAPEEPASHPDAISDEVSVPPGETGDVAQRTVEDAEGLEPEAEAAPPEGWFRDPDASELRPAGQDSDLDATAPDDLAPAGIAAPQEMFEASPRGDEPSVEETVERSLAGPPQRPGPRAPEAPAEPRSVDDVAPVEAEEAEPSSSEGMPRLDRSAVVRELAGLFDDAPPSKAQPPEDASPEPDERKRVEDDDQVNKGLISRLIDGVKGL